jgi:hypothetical protein
LRSCLILLLCHLFVISIRVVFLLLLGWRYSIFTLWTSKVKLFVQLQEWMNQLTALFASFYSALWSCLPLASSFFSAYAFRMSKLLTKSEIAVDLSKTASIGGMMPSLTLTFI